MGIDVKKLSLVLAVALMSVFSIAPIQAAEKPTTVPGCKTPTAKAHAPATVKEPMSVAKALPKTMTIDTNCGAIVISLLINKAPLTITKLSALARAKYFDLSFCHRLTTEGLFVLQCGDPTASGSGNPTGWKGYKDENLPANKANNYPVGTVAMANSGPGTNGSQFFITVGPTPHLNRKHTIFGEVKDAASQGVVDAIATTRTGAGDKPVKDVVINSVTVA